MLRLCSYMMSDSITTVKKHIDNLRAYVVPPADSN